MVEETLNTKRRDLSTLIDHIVQMESSQNQQDGTVLNCVVSRLMAELRRAEVEAMRQHILSCPGLSHDSLAYQTAMPALNDALDLISVKEKKMQMSVLSPPELAAAASFLSQEDAFSRINRDNSSFSELDFTDHLTNNSHSHSHNNSPVTSPAKTITPILVPTQNPMNNRSSSSSSKVASHSKSSINKTQKSSSTFFKWLLRTTLLDVPFTFSALLFFSCLCTKHMYFTFMEPVMESVQWTKQRMDTEYTNYRRECDESDISTTNVDDIIIDPKTMTAGEAMHITNKHGMSVFPNVVTDEAAEEMRKWVLHRNANLSGEDAIPLISQNQRWSFPIGADEDPSVPPVLRQIATNVLLQNTMDLLMGEDPALVELTAITSGYGAGDQHWHADNDFQGSQMHYARSFVPMYSIFVPLQDTTAKMGATSACPGTHLCGSQDKLADVCDDLNFQVHDTRGRLAESDDDHIWKMGDAFLFNLNLYHRGPGHTDPNGEERVMLIMTVSNRPKGPQFDRRQISLGTSYSCKWDMWGMTMKDLAIVETMVGRPWKYLRTLGIWKPRTNHRSHDMKWGWDYITVACSRIMNDQMGFRYEDLDGFVHRMSKYGPIVEYLFGYLPEEGKYNDVTESVDNGWRDYLRESSKRILFLATVIYAGSCVSFLLINLLVTGFASTSKRFIKINTVIGGLLYGWYNHVSNSPWGKDILAGKAQMSPFLDRVETTVLTVVPTKYDVLFSERLNSPFLAGMNVIFDHQLGNDMLNSLVDQFSSAFAQNSNAPNDVQSGILKIIKNDISSIRGRFLQNDVNGDWFSPSEKEVDNLVRLSLVAESNPFMKIMHQEMKYLKAACIHGRMRKTVMMKSHALANLSSLTDRLFGSEPNETRSMKPFSWQHRMFIPRISYRSVDKAKKKKTSSTDKSDTYTPKEGDIIEYHYDGDGWFKGQIVSMNKRTRTLAIQFNDGDYASNLSRKKVRKFEPYRDGDRVIAFGKLGTYMGVKATGDAMIRLDSGGIAGVDVNKMSRP